MKRKRKTGFTAFMIAAVMLIGTLNIQAYADAPKTVYVSLVQNIEGGKLYGRDAMLVWEKIREYAAGGTVAIIAEPDDGWRLKEIMAYWRPDPFKPYQNEAIPIREGYNEYLFTVPNGNVDVGAIFEKEYPVNATVSGEGTASAGVQRAVLNEVVQIKATPDQDWIFVEWSSEDASIQFENKYNAETTFTMPEGETTVHARFQKKPEAYLLTHPTAISDLTYNANPQDLITPGTAGAGTMEYKFDYEDDQAWRTQIPAAINAGTYYVQYRAGRDEYHSPQTTVPGTVTVKIKPKQIEPKVTLEGWTYEDNSEHIPVITGNEGNVKPIITYKETGAEESAYTDEQPVNAGTYNVRAQIPEEGNFLSGEAVGEFTIAKKEIGINKMGVLASAITYGQKLKESKLTADHPYLIEYSWKQPDLVPDAITYAYGIQPTVVETMKQNYRLPEGVDFSVPLNVYPALPDMTVQIEKNKSGKTAVLTAAVKKAGAGSVPGGSVMFYYWNDTENEWQQIQGDVSTESTEDNLIATLSGWDYSGVKSENCLIKASYDGSDKNYGAAEAQTRFDARNSYVTVVNGTAGINGQDPSSVIEASPDATVTIKANAAAHGKVFEKWIVTSKNADLRDAYSSETTFTMGSEDVEVTAVYRDLIQYTVIWLDGNGSELDRKIYHENETEPTTDKIPKKDFSLGNTYSFISWDNGKTSGTTTTYRPRFRSYHFHDFDKGVVTKEPTCTQKGEMTFICKYNHTHVMKKEIAALAHTPAGPAIENVKEPTYMEEGSYEEVIRCSICGRVLSTEKKTIARSEKTDLSLAVINGIKNKTYTGKKIVQSFAAELNGTKLVRGLDYEVEYRNNKNAGTAKIILRGINAYTGEQIREFRIKKAKNPLYVRTSEKEYKRSGLTGKRSFKIGAAGAKGKVSYRLTKAAKNAGIKVSKKGKITVPKNCKKGTYTIKVKASGNRNYKSKTIKITVVIK